MKWIGQHIYDLVSKFRSEDNIVTIDPGSIKPLTIFQPVNDASPRIDMGSSDSERFSIRSFYASGTQTLQTVFFSTDTESATANYGAFRFNVDDVNILDIDDGGIDLDANKGISINGTDILTDSSGTATLSNIDALDATTIATIETAVEANIDSLTGPITLTQGSTGGGSAFKIDNDDVDQAALEIEAANTTAHAVSIGAAAVTTRSGIFMNCDSLTTGSAIDLDIDDATTTNNTRSLVKVDYDKAGVVAAEQTIATTGLDINMADAATNHADGIVTMVGAQIDVDSANAQGTITQKGLVLNVAADGVADTATTSGIEMEVVNGGTDIKMMSHANTSDYCTIATTTNGATTITTVDADAASANFEVAADGDITLDAEGDIKLEPKSGGSILLDGTIDVDAGVVTGATSITSTAFVGDLTGDVTGNADTATTAGTVTTAAQPNIESIGTDGDTLAINSDLLNMVNTSTQAPNIALNCQANDATGPTLSLMNQRVSGGATQAGANNDVLGNIDFWGYNDAGTPESTNYIAIVGSIADATDGEEAAKLDLQVKAHGYIIPTTGLKLDGDTGVAQQVNVTIGNGAASVVTIPGDIDLAGDIDVDGTLEADALTVGGVAFTPSTTKNVTHHTIKDDIGTSVVYISLGEIDAESGTKSNKNLPILAPVAGKLLKVFLRTGEDMSGSGHNTNLTWRLLSRTTSSTTVGNATVIGTQTGAGPTASSMATYDFTTGLDSGTNAIAAGDKVQLSVQSDAASADGLYFITCLWEWDFS